MNIEHPTFRSQHRTKSTARTASRWISMRWFVVTVAGGLLLPPTAPALVVVATNLVMAVPSAPGYIGIYHATAKEAMLVFIPNDPDTAFAFAVVLHIFGFLPLAVAGAAALVREGLSFSALRAGAPAPARPPIEQKITS